MSGAAEAGPQQRRLRVLVVDDHDVVHWGFRLMLTQQSWVERCVSAHSGPEAVTMVTRYRPHVARELAAGTRLNLLVKPMLGLFHGAPGARTWRRILTVESVRRGAGMEVLDAALDAVSLAAERRLEPA